MRVDACVIFKDYLKNICVERHMIQFWKRFVCSQILCRLVATVVAFMAQRCWM